jgi:hypothetical protein
MRGRFVLFREDLARIVMVSEQIWDHVFPHFPGFTGLVRFDLIPRLVGGGDYVAIVGVYEINAQAPECIGALCALENEVPGSVDPRGLRRFFEAVSSLGGHEIFFLVGSGKVKTSWAHHVEEVLSRFGLSLRRIGEDDIGSLPPQSVLWRWGAVGTAGAEFSLQTWEALKQAVARGVVVFNTPPTEWDWWPGHKSLLIGLPQVGRSFEVRWSKIPTLLFNRRKWVLKPLSNVESGGGLVFGELEGLRSWARALVRASRGSYGAFEARWLPCVSMAGEKFAMDLNATFFVYGKLKYLYSIIRLTPWTRYEKFRVINVAQGGFLIPVWEHPTWEV